MKKLILFSYLLVGLIIINSAIAYPQLKGYVNDFANVLTTPQESDLSKTIGLIEKNTSVQIAVVLVANTEGHDTSEYAIAIGEQNGVGGADIDNGVVILWSLDNMKGGFIATGRGIEHILTDAEVSRIGRAARSQFIDKGDYYNGMTFIVQEIYKELQRSEVTTSSSFSIPLWLWISLLIIFILVFFVGKNISSDDDSLITTSTVPYITSRKSRKRERDSDYSSLAAASYISSKSSYDDDDSSSSGGGFSGFGGGSFGGGGGRF